MKTSRQIRQEFLDFFVERGHTVVPSSPVVPHDDPTLMFTNAGMNQFKDVFLGTGRRPYSRAVNSQKCIRVSGKHNDLEEVGRDTYHHTFFEMLGNWSFGDYYKAEAIRWAWELLTEVWGLPKERLYATVYEEDDEAASLWPEVTDLAPSRVLRFGRKDNFWEMGDVGPCGPCTEIHYDFTDDGSGRGLINTGDPRVIEVWNLVFIQYNRDEQGRLHELPAKHVDTGMGFERLCAILQGKQSNYDTDLFTPLLEAIASLTGHRYQGRVGPDAHVDTAFRVVADHVRMLTFAITDGARPSNEGRGYVVRRILRRAARFARQHLDQREPFLCRLVPAVVDVLGDVFPEIAEHRERVQAIIRDEEISFGRTLDRGIERFRQDLDEALRRGHRCIPAEQVWDLYQTYGFPPDLTRLMAAEHGLTIDEEGFERIRQKERERARAQARARAAGMLAFTGTLPATDDSPKYETTTLSAPIVGWIEGNRFVTSGRLEPGRQAGLVLQRTCFYAEQGGQVGDTGTITTPTGTFDVEDTQRLGEAVVHIGEVEDGAIEAGQVAHLQVDPRREDTRRNHTATHLLHWALREVLGDHVTQRGSVVAPDRLRFDFDHHRPVHDDELRRIEMLVNERIYADDPVSTRVLPIDEARRLPGVRAFFGEKYGDLVRVVEIGDGYSREFCGGTHLSHTGQTGPFKIVSEEPVAKGVRRITAVTGPEAVAAIQRMDEHLRSLERLLNAPRDDLPRRVEALQEEIRALRKQIEKGVAADLRTLREQMLASAIRVAGTAIVVSRVPPAPVPQVRETIDWLRSRAGSAAVLLASCEDRNVTLVAGVTRDLAGRVVHAGQWVAEVAGILGGRGGGKPDMAQGGGRAPDRLDEALERARQWVQQRLETAAAS